MTAPITKLHHLIDAVNHALIYSIFDWAFVILPTWEASHNPINARIDGRINEAITLAVDQTVSTVLHKLDAAP